MLLVPAMNSVIQHKTVRWRTVQEGNLKLGRSKPGWFSLGNIFARQQSIVGPISNGKEACVVVFPTVLLVLVHGPLQHCFRGRLASRTISVSAEWITTSVWSRMCLPVIGNSSLVNLNVLNYNGGDFPGIQRVFTCITCIRLLVHEPFLSIYQASLTYYTSKKVQTT